MNSAKAKIIKFIRFGLLRQVRIIHQCISARSEACPSGSGAAVDDQATFSSEIVGKGHHWSRKTQQDQTRASRKLLLLPEFGLPLHCAVSYIDISLPKDSINRTVFITSNNCSVLLIINIKLVLPCECSSNKQ